MRPVQVFEVSPDWMTFAPSPHRNGAAEHTLVHKTRLSVRARRVIVRAYQEVFGGELGINLTLSQVAMLSEEELREQKNCGNRTIEEIRKTLIAVGLDVKSPWEPAP